MKITVGMATYDDFDGVYFSVQALRLHHQVDEIVVVDNAPNVPSAKMTAQFCATVGARYVPMPSPVGTSAPRDRVFAEATGDAVVCIDSHVLLGPRAIDYLRAWYDAHPDSLDLLSGPLLWDHLKSGATHFDPIWREQMWGIWGQAWRCACSGSDSAPGSDPIFPVASSASDQGKMGLTPSAPLVFSNVQDERLARCQFLELPSGQPAQYCPACGRALPDLAWSGSEPKLLELGYRPACVSPDEQPFAAPGQGLGLFACRKDAWLGFSHHFEGFGGEELYIHRKFENAGRRNMILPGLRWVHRFGRLRTPYPDSIYSKVRNYVIGHQELGLDLEPIEKTFVASGLIPRAEFELLLRDPIHNRRGVAQAAVHPTDAKPTGLMSPEELLAWCASIPRDLDQHLADLAALAAQCRHVTEFSGRRESTIALLAGLARSGPGSDPIFAVASETSDQGKMGLTPSVEPHSVASGSPDPLHRPPALISHNTETDPLLADVSYRFGGLVQLDALDSPAVPSIDDTDLLFLDTEHTSTRLRDELRKYAGSVRRWIIVHDTAIYGVAGTDGQPGLLTAIDEYVAAHAEWFVASHTPKQYGLTVLSRDEADRPAAPIRLLPLGHGPGSELKKLLKQLGIQEKPDCKCNARMNQMDDWGIAGCRDRIDEIVTWLREGQESFGWKDKLAAAAKAVQTGIAFQINWADPFPGLVELAIARAEESEQA